MWWSDDPKRAREERAAFAELFEEKPWLVSAAFRHADDLELCVDVDITHGGETFPLTLFYPTAFPDIPPIVKSREGKQLSNHQYGKDGELCLQYRPENWESSVTGAMMIESAQALISAERPLDGPTVPVPSANHNLSLGAELRLESWRMTVPPKAWNALAAFDTMMPEAMLKLSVDQMSRFPTSVTSLVGIGENDSIWCSNQPTKPGAVREIGYLLRTQSEMSFLLERREWRLDDLLERVPALATVLPTLNRMHLLVQDANGRRSALGLFQRVDKQVFVLPYRLIDEGAAARRNASDRMHNSEKRVAGSCPVAWCRSCPPTAFSGLAGGSFSVPRRAG